jgi:hypothetical protein
MQRNSQRTQEITVHNRKNPAKYNISIEPLNSKKNRKNCSVGCEPILSSLKKLQRSSSLSAISMETFGIQQQDLFTTSHSIHYPLPPCPPKKIFRQ